MHKVVALAGLATALVLYGAKCSMELKPKLVSSATTAFRS